MKKEQQVKEITTTATVEVTMTVASEQFKATLDKEGGDIRLQERHSQSPAFSIARPKLDELIQFLTKIRDVHAPQVDKFGED